MDGTKPKQARMNFALAFMLSLREWRGGSHFSATEKRRHEKKTSERHSTGFSPNGYDERERRKRQISAGQLTRSNGLSG